MKINFKRKAKNLFLSKDKKRINTLENEIETLKENLKSDIYLKVMKAIDNEEENKKLKETNKRLRLQIKELKAKLKEK